MRIIVTGAAGTLGKALLPRLNAAGHTAVAIDRRQGTGLAEWRVVDLSDALAVANAIEGADVIVHGAALHGIHLEAHGSRAFYDTNVTGTFNVWQAAAKHDVLGVVFSSTMGVYGESRRPASDNEVVFVDEDMPSRPGDIYGWSKLVGEELAKLHFRHDDIPSVALRFGMFVPEPFFRYGIRLLYGGVHEDDVADSVMAAIGAIVDHGVAHEAFNVFSPLPFTPDDAPALRTDPLTAIERHYPGAGVLLRSRGVRSLQPIKEVFPTDKLELGLFRPRHNFGEWLDELGDRPDERAETNPPWP